VDLNGLTSASGIFAAGDVTNVKSKQIIIAAGDGALATRETFDFLMKEIMK
jgi:alkyl hydroperoxide reductase subunit F